MLDELYLQCNSRNSIDMLAEWDRSWETTVGEFPINRKLWYELRSRHFTINKSCTPEVDAALAVKFKRRILEVVPVSDRDYAPLTLAIQNDKLKCTMGSAEILKQLTELAQLQSYDVKPVKAKIMGQKSGKRAADDLDQREKKQPKMEFYCSHHKENSSHSTEDCRFLVSQQNRGKAQAPKASLRKKTSTPGTKPSTILEKAKTPISSSRKAYQSLEAKVEELTTRLAKSESSTPIRILSSKTNAGHQ
ncbi:hypothetical protein BJ741DRAFT_609636 [Chytriomyces cf. hyalinus JEL632]|nr:hypothetical protein BJ741DRAFT_609636 [Chytriomyces cf. hyalinus JEL632]